MVFGNLFGTSKEKIVVDFDTTSIEQLVRETSGHVAGLPLFNHPDPFVVRTKLVAHKGWYKLRDTTLFAKGKTHSLSFEIFKPEDSSVYQAKYFSILDNANSIINHQKDSLDAVTLELYFPDMH